MLSVKRLPMPGIAGLVIRLIVMLLVSSPLPAIAIPAITCHCFTDRSYDPARPTIADPYFLATTQNSFFAELFNIDKKTLVMKKQQGTSSDDLWIAYRVALKSGKTAEGLLRTKQEKGTWRKTLAALGFPAKKVGNRFSIAMGANLPDEKLAEAVVDDIFLGYRLLPEKELAAIRRTGGSNQELIISTVISARVGKPVGKIYLDVKSGSKTWGSLLQDARIDTKDIQQEVSTLIRSKKE